MSSLRLWILGCITLSPLLIKSLYDDERDVVYRLFVLASGVWWAGDSFMSRLWYCSVYLHIYLAWVVWHVPICYQWTCKVCIVYCKRHASVTQVEQSVVILKTLKESKYWCITHSLNTVIQNKSIHSFHKYCKIVNYVLFTIFSHSRCNYTAMS